jgi:hypothetical protein
MRSVHGRELSAFLVATAGGTEQERCEPVLRCNILGRSHAMAS